WPNYYHTLFNHLYLTITAPEFPQQRAGNSSSSSSIASTDASLHSRTPIPPPPHDTSAASPVLSMRSPAGRASISSPLSRSGLFQELQINGATMDEQISQGNSQFTS
ncbi:hypothetical protein EJB05_47505, partial [Eragrostis curvula]